MGQCEVCGNEYDKTFEVVAAGQRHVFDSFECAAHRLALCASTVAARSSATASKSRVASIAVLIARGRPSAPARCGTALVVPRRECERVSCREASGRTGV